MSTTTFMPSAQFVPTLEGMIKGPVRTVKETHGPLDALSKAFEEITTDRWEFSYSSSSPPMLETLAGQISALSNRTCKVVKIEEKGEERSEEKTNLRVENNPQSPPVREELPPGLSDVIVKPDTYLLTCEKPWYTSLKNSLAHYTQATLV